MSNGEQLVEANLPTPPEPLSTGRLGVKGRGALWDQTRVEMGPSCAEANLQPYCCWVRSALLRPSPVQLLVIPSTGTGLPLSVTCSSTAGWEMPGRPSLVVQEHK